jgi:hypothetical protein
VRRTVRHHLTVSHVPRPNFGWLPITLVLAACLSQQIISLASPGGIAHKAESTSQSQPDTKPGPETKPIEIESLALRVTTRRDSGAGTDNAVYFDIGPFAWRLGKPHHNDFERGASYTYDLKKPKDIRLTTDDILWLRLHKKGIAGVTGLGDGFDDAWHPESITLVVNGNDYKTVAIEDPLNSRCWYWRSQDPDDHDLNIFASSLRMLPNKRLNLLDKVTGIFTTNLFKKHGISGWLLNPVERQCNGSAPRSDRTLALPPICATGEVIAKGISDDGLETIDLRLARLESFPGDSRGTSQDLVLDKTQGFVQPRYLRVENGYRHNQVFKGDIARICGDVLWDTDREGWWEIHPRKSDDVRRAPR